MHLLYKYIVVDIYVIRLQKLFLFSKSSNGRITRYALSQMRENGRLCNTAKPIQFAVGANRELVDFY